MIGRLWRRRPRGGGSWERSPDALAAEVAELMRSRLHLRGGDLATLVRRGRSQLPRRLRADAEVLAAAEQAWHDPRRAHHWDPDRVERAHERLTAWLKGVDPAERAAAKRTAWLAGMVVNLALALAAGAALWLWLN